MDDDRIIELFFKRSEQAIVELSGKYGSICSRIAQNILNDQLDSEECVNDAYLVVWNSIPPQRPDSIVRTVPCEQALHISAALQDPESPEKTSDTGGISL